MEQEKGSINSSFRINSKLANSKGYSDKQRVNETNPNMRISFDKSDHANTKNQIFTKSYDEKFLFNADYK